MSIRECRKNYHQFLKIFENSWKDVLEKKDIYWIVLSFLENIYSCPQVAARGVPVAEFNMEHTPATEEFGFHFQGPCGVTLPPAISWKYSWYLSTISNTDSEEFHNIYLIRIWHLRSTKKP